MAMRTLRRHKCGFTLLEVLIAIGILAIGMVTVFSLFPIALHSVKFTVDNSRGGALTESARAELTAGGAPAAILAAGARSYAGSHVPFGPWTFPADLRTFRAPLYRYVDTTAVPGVLHNRVVFDERTMVPITLNGLFTGGFTVNIPGVVQNRDTDLLEYFYDFPGSTYAPWEIYLKVRGRKYKIVDRTYGGATLSDLFTLDVDPGGPGLPNIGPTPIPFEILLPVAMKETPVDVPLEAAGAVSYFAAVAPGPYTIVTESANIAANLVVGGWVSVEGDWYQVASVIPPPTAPPTTMPTSFSITLSGTDPGPAPDIAGASFRLPLPVVTFNSLAASADSMPLPVVAGSGPQLTYLESGAWVEFVFDGAKADFFPTNTFGRDIVLNVTDFNNDTTPFIMPGNFIRIDGHDYEIASVLQDLDLDTQVDDFRLVGTVPTYGTGRYFHIVLGYDPTAATQVPGVARFPVTSVTRGATGLGPVYGRPVTEFVVGKDVNDNLPTDLWAAAAPDPFRTPVHVLPANRTSFSYQVVTEQKSSRGTFTAGSPNVDAPDPGPGPASVDIPAIPYPPVFDRVIMNTVSSSVFSLRALSRPEAAGVALPSTDIINTLNSNSTLVLAGIGPPPAFNLTTPIPFHAWDANDFSTDFAVGQGTFVAPLTVDFTPVGSSLINEAIFFAPNVWVRLLEVGGSGRVSVTTITSVPVPPQFNTITVLGAGSLAIGDVVTVSILGSPSAPPGRNWPWGRGSFIEGSDCVVSVYTDDSPAFAPFPGNGIPGRGFPYPYPSPTRFHLAVGDYIQAPTGDWYAVKAIHDDPGADFLILDRPYTGASNSDFFFRYVTPMPEAYNAQVVVFRNYRIQSLQDASPAKDLAAAFGFDVSGFADPEKKKVRLATAMPPNMKPGHYIRADGDASHPVAAPTEDPGLGDSVDGDWRWYMIESIGPAGLGPGDLDYRKEVTLTTPYLGHIPAAQTFQPASVTGSVIRTFDTIIGAF